LIFDILYLILLWEGVPPRGWAPRQPGRLAQRSVPKSAHRRARRLAPKLAPRLAGNQARKRASRLARRLAGELAGRLPGRLPGELAGRLAPIRKFSISKSKFLKNFRSATKTWCILSRFGSATGRLSYRLVSFSVFTNH
jgi:hypothetical protein